VPFSCCTELPGEASPEVIDECFDVLGPGAPCAAGRFVQMPELPDFCRDGELPADVHEPYYRRITSVDRIEGGSSRPASGAIRAETHFMTRVWRGEQKRPPDRPGPFGFQRPSSHQARQHGAAAPTQGFPEGLPSAQNRAKRPGAGDPATAGQLQR